jgi:rRNA pseudouridine-1189 N-methylase Emg1 (Nep1/Mra1 family)
VQDLIQQSLELIAQQILGDRLPVSNTDEERVIKIVRLALENIFPNTEFEVKILKEDSEMHTIREVHEEPLDTIVFQVTGQISKDIEFIVIGNDPVQASKIADKIECEYNILSV